MQVNVRTKNVTENELAKALVGYILHEHMSDDVIDYLRKSDDHKNEHEPIPERYMKAIVKRMQTLFTQLRVRLDNNLMKWFTSLGESKRWGKKKTRMIGHLSDDEIDELRRLIESHFKLAIGVDIRLPDEVKKKWKANGIVLPPQGNMESGIVQSYVSGRLHTILKATDSYETMLKMARQFVPTRQDQLIIDAAKANAAKYMVGYGRKLADLAEDMLLEHQKGTVHDIVQRYFSGELTHTTYNAEGFTPQEVESQLATEKSVQGWRELATELKNRFKATDISRDWDRIAVSETRYASNLGALVTIQEEGGGDADEIMLYYHVHQKACKYCKKLYLHEDGTPKLFPLAEILHNVQETGGMNVGLKASLIGEPGGWVPNALAHPHCLTGDMRVVADDILATSERFYDGDIVIFQTANGNSLSCTPNHPILTDRGWVGAGFLNIGDNVISRKISERETFGGDVNHKNVPTSIQKIINSFRSSSDVSSIPMPVSAEDFHGDGESGDIAIVGADSFLLHEILNAPHSQCVGDLFLKIRDMELPFFDGLSNFDSVRNRSFRSPHSIMGRSGLVAPLFGSHLGKTNKLSFTPVSSIDIPFPQTTINNNTPDSVMSGEGLDGFAVEISRNDFIDRESNSVMNGSVNFASIRNAEFFQSADNGYSCSPVLSTDFLESLAGEIIPDQVINIERRFFRGQVYNLQTESEMYIAENIITHNCQCIPTRYMKKYASFEPKEEDLK